MIKKEALSRRCPKKMHEIDERFSRKLTQKIQVSER